MVAPYGVAQRHEGGREGEGGRVLVCEAGNDCSEGHQAALRSFLGAGQLQMNLYEDAGVL